jgi:chromosome segregation ATPase
MTVTATTANNMSSFREPSPEMFVDEDVNFQYNLIARINELERLNAHLEKTNEELRSNVSNLTMSALSQAAKIRGLEEEVADLKYMHGQAEVAAEEYKELYDQACDYTGQQAINLNNHVHEIRELHREIYKLKYPNDLIPCATVDPCATVETQTNNPTMEQSFKQLRASLQDFKNVSGELFAKYGSFNAIEAAGVWNTPEYKDYGFNYVDELANIYEEFMPVIFR